MDSMVPAGRPGGESWQDVSADPGAVIADDQQHRVVAVRGWRGGTGAAYVDWRAACGAEGETPAELQVIRYRWPQTLVGGALVPADGAPNCAAGCW